MVTVAAVDAEEHKSLAGEFGVGGFPTIIGFVGGKKSGEPYQGPRTAQARFRPPRPPLSPEASSQR